MKAIVSSKLRGTILLPTIRTTSFKAKDTFSLSDEQYYAPDVQKAINNSDIKIHGKTPKPTKFLTVSNIGNTSVILPEVGVLRSGKSIELPAHLAKHQEVINLLTKKLIKKGGQAGQEIEETDKPVIVRKSKIQDKVSNNSGPDAKMSAVAYKPKGVDIRPTPTDLRDTPPPTRKTAEDKGKKKKGIVKKHATGDLLLDIENGTVPGESDGITFVDVAGNGLEDGALGFVDSEQQQARIKNHPNLGKSE